jgi:pSer/pThr/pTyr-binding forkhead associated (FHA) protein
MAFLIVEKGDNRDIGRKFNLPEGTAVIGRAADDCRPDIDLHYSFISRNHAEITFNSDHFSIRDLGSTNGTSIDGERIETGKYCHLKDDSVIGLGTLSGGARVLLRFKESTAITTTRLDGIEETSASSPVFWMRIDEAKGEIRVDGKLLTLSKKEYLLAVFLYKRAGTISRKDELISDIWPEAVDSEGVSDAAIDQLVHRLRAKIEPDPARHQRLKIKKGFGYMLV